MSVSASNSLWTVNPTNTATVDAYAASTSDSNVVAFDFTILGTEPFPHKFRLQSTAKNASASACGMGLIDIAIQRATQ